MEPLNRKESFELIRDLFGPAETITIAAPFFGDGALTQLGLEKSAAKLTVICDLFSGGCNPHEIKKFLNPESDLRTHDRLHAKIYLTDKGVVIGSANPSANGLGFEGNELDGQIEACVYSEEPNTVRAWKQFVEDEIYPKSRKIEKSDIQKAKWLWESKRNARTRVNLGTLLETMKSDQEYFKDKRISFWLWPYRGASRSADKEYEYQKVARQDDSLFYYEFTEGEQPPDPGTTIVSFYYKPNTANVEFDGITKVVERKHIVKANNGSIVLLVYDIPDVEGTKFPRKKSENLYE
jgi:hypothetical protein